MTSMFETMKARAYYKGTSLECPIDNQDKYMTLIIEKGHSQIEKFLRAGETMDNTIKCLTEQLDTMEEGLCYAEKKSGVKWATYSSKNEYMLYLKNASYGALEGDEFLACWWVNIASLLELKVIKNDEMNGWWIPTVMK